MTKLDYNDLRVLDAAERGALSAAQCQRADELLQRIIATPVIEATTARPNAAPPTRLSRPVILVAAVAATVIAASIAIPGWGGSGTAYASWTADPTPTASQDLDAVLPACRDQLTGYTHFDGGVRLDAANIPVALAERRGNYVAVLFHSDNPDTSASCVVINRAGSGQVADVKTSVGSSSGPSVTPPTGQLTVSSISQFGGDTPASFVDGAVGPGVAGVSINAGGRLVNATVRNGRYAAWWPGTAFTDRPAQSDGRGGPTVDLTYNITLTDGTIRSDVQPSHT